MGDAGGGPGLEIPDIAIVGRFPFPTGAAASNNLRGHCRALQEAGFTVGVFPDQAAGRPSDRRPDGRYFFAGSEYWSLCPARPNTRRENLRRRLPWASDPRMDFLFADPHRSPRAVITYPTCESSVPMLRGFGRLCASRGIPLFSFVVEWHAPSGYEGRWGPFDFLDGEVQRRLLNRRLSGVLCISKYLQNYYSKRRCRSLLLPPLLDLSEPEWAAVPRPADPPGRPLRILFSGSFARDRQDLIIQAVKRVREEGGALRLEYLGATREAITRLPGVGAALVDSLGDGICFHGRVPDAEVRLIAGAADFAVLFRPDARWSRACFPSKVPEFLALGVPILCNLTSDLGEYLQDGREALIAPDLTVGGLAATLRRALALSPAMLGAMRCSARTCASSFDARRFASLYRDFLSPSCQ